MLQNYYPIYQIALDLQDIRRTAYLWRDSPKVKTDPPEDGKFQALIKAIQRECPVLGLTATAEMAERLIAKPPPATYAAMFADLDHLDGTLSGELKKEAVYRIRPELGAFYEQDHLFGEKVSVAFSSCARDIRKAGSCYALEQEDACVHHLMLVLERGLHALADKIDVPYQRTNWQIIITDIGNKLKTFPKGTEKDFYLEVNAQFGFLKDAYRNHSEHARDDFYDLPKALSILNHVRGFMQALEKGGLSE